MTTGLEKYEKGTRKIRIYGSTVYRFQKNGTIFTTKGLMVSRRHGAHGFPLDPTDEPGIGGTKRGYGLCDLTVAEDLAASTVECQFFSGLMESKKGLGTPNIKHG